MSKRLDSLKILVKTCSENPYDFYYKLTEEQRLFMIKNQQFFGAKRYLYFPIELSEDCFNYGFNQGLLILLKPLSACLSKKELAKYQFDPNWIKLGAFSPDDLDLDLEWSGDYKLYLKIRKTVKNLMNCGQTTYKDFLKAIQQEYGGELD